MPATETMVMGGIGRRGLLAGFGASAIFEARATHAARRAERECLPLVLAHGAPPFAFCSALFQNLHHFLYVVARARIGLPDASRSAVVGAPAELSRAPLDVTSARAMGAALAYYERRWAKLDPVFDDELREATGKLLIVETLPAGDDAGLGPEHAAVLRDAAPVYRTNYWARHDADNRAWVMALAPSLVTSGPALAEAVARYLRARWAPLPIRVDVCPYANWAGAYSTIVPRHIVAASGDDATRGSQALEILFHEAGHQLLSPLDAALSMAGARLGRAPPRALAHALLFATVGALVAREVSGHVPYADANGLWAKGAFSALHGPIETHWRPYLDNKCSFDEAVLRLVSACPAG